MNTIKPTAVTQYGRTRAELEKFWLYCLFVAGKNSDIQTLKLDKFIGKCRPNESPFEHIRREMEFNQHYIGNNLRVHAVGQYNRLERAIKESLKIDLQTCYVQDLEAIHGVGPKTARFFLLHSFKGCRFAVIDTHLLKWARMEGLQDLPAASPSNPMDYWLLETEILDLIDQRFGRDIDYAQIDLLIWSSLSGRLNEHETL